MSSYFLITVISLATVIALHLFISLLKNKPAFKFCLDKYFLQLKLLIFIFHLVTAFVLGGEVSDVKLFATAGYWLWHKVDIYWIDASHGTYPFLPFTIYPYTLFWLISQRVPLLTFSFLIKVVLIPILFLTASLIGKILRKKRLKKQKANLTQLLFLTNPVLFLAITFHGQADIALIYFFILSVFYLKPSLILAGIFMAISIMIKSWSVIFLPLVFFKIKKLRKKIIYFCSLFLTVFAFLSLYKKLVYTSFSRILSSFFSHPAGATGYWGITGLLRLLPLQTSLIIDFFSQYRFFILLAGLSLGLFLFWKKGLNLFKGAHLFILIVYALTAGWGLQHSIWIIPFALLNKNWQKNNIYSLISLPYLSLSYLAIAASWQSPKLDHLIIFLALLPWFYSVLWLFSQK